MNGLRQRWWKSAAIAMVGGTIAAGGWFGFARAEPLPNSQFKGVQNANAKAEPVVPWVRSSAAPRIEPLGEKVLPAASKFPAILDPSSVPTAPTVIPASAKVPAPAASMPLTPVLTQPPAPPMTPTVPAIPDTTKTIPVPAVPTSIDPIPAPAPVIPTVPKVDEPLKPVISPPLKAAPSSLPTNSPDSAKPMLPLPSDFNLRPMNGGNNVKPDDRATPTVPVLVPTPVPTVPMMPDPIPAIPTGTGSGMPQVPTFTGSRTKPEDVPFAPTEKYVFPAPVTTAPTGIPTPTYTQPTTPGVSPMLNNPTVMAALTGVALAFGPGAQADDPKAADPVQMKKDLDEANRKLLIAQRDIDQLSTLLYGRKDDKGNRLEYDPGALEEIKRLKDKVAALEKQVGDMKNSTSLRPNIPAATGKGTVRVVNEYPIPVSIIINDKNYRVEPSTTLNVDVPVGDFSYQLLQSGAAATRSTIKEKEVVTLRVK